MKVFISGASGLVGGNCYRFFKEKGWTVIGSHFSYPLSHTVYFDSLHPENPESFDIQKFQPDVILHCGALTHVDYCEDNIEESYQKTVKSTENLALIAKKCNAQFIFISTDYVFDGENGPYAENATTNPLSVYGKHKLDAENIVKSILNNFLIIRITNVYGDEVRGKNFISRILQQCKDLRSISLKLPVDQFASPINAWDIARALFLLIQDNKKGLYHFASTDYLNRVSLALKVLSYYPEASYSLQTLTTKELQQAAPRPLLGGLIPYRFLKEYPDFQFSNVDNYLIAKKEKKN